MSRNPKKRRGSAVVESAILLPVLVLLVFAAIEASNAIFLRQSLTVAAFETASVAALTNSSETVARARCAEVLAARNVTEHTVTFTPTIDATISAGTPIEVEVEAPASAYRVGPVWFLRSKVLSATVTMVRM